MAIDIDPGYNERLVSFITKAEELGRQQEELRQMILIGRKRQRRRYWLSIVGFVLAVYTAISLHDQHVQHCMVLGKPSTVAEQRICNTTIFGHRHELHGFGELSPEALVRLRELLLLP